ncbi:Plasma membrane sulfite pump involved in sulfite metabolism [Tulasnella sp. 419]|nr:Plasma membrane sulfite pump involved in sulfite metabolism [Tulasnella sp. 419]
MITIRYTKYPEILALTLNHSQHSLFLGCIPMGLVTILSGISVITQQAYHLGVGWTLIVSYIWWVDLAASCFFALLVPYMVFTTHSHAAENYTAALLLPVVPTITAAASGGRMALLLLSAYPTYAWTMCLASYAILGIGLSLAMMILALFLQRLTFHHLPPNDVIVSVFLPLGPCGQGGYALILLGKVVLELARTTSLLPPYLQLAAPAAYAVGLVSGLALFGLGMWWWLVAVVAFVSRAIQNDPTEKLGFNMGWWGFTFPLASLTLCTLALATELDSLPFKIIGSIMVCVVLILWFYVALRTGVGAFKGTIFHAPCVQDWRKGQKLLQVAENSLTQVDQAGLRENAQDASSAV